MPLFQALSFFNLSKWAARKFLAHVFQPARVIRHAGKGVAKQSASNRHWTTKLLHCLWLLVLLRVWLLFVVLLLLMRPFF